MRRVAWTPGAGFEIWRESVRELLKAQILPADVTWVIGDQDSLLADADSDAARALESTPGTARIPREFPELADALLAHSDPQSPALAYRILWRLTHGEPKLLDLVTDADIVRAQACRKSVGRDQHKMKAFVRFREIAGEDGVPLFIAWFEPAHFIVERVAPFFMRRFTGMRWVILTPYRSAYWNGEVLAFGPGATRGDAPSEDALEDLWRTYYASIFNPARLKLQAMRSEMPVKYWKNLPEARLIPGLIREAAARSEAMVQKLPTIPRGRIPAPVPVARDAPLAGSLQDLRAQARDCRRCALWEPATQTVFGVGPEGARVMLVGEQPGDREDLAGKPFIGPAGQLLEQALDQAGLDRSALYVTNTVKHFKFEPRGKLRMHKRADPDEQQACRPWLDAEIAQLRPDLILCLGAVAASALMGRGFRLAEERGQWFTQPGGTRVMATLHPAHLLRLPDTAARAQGFADLVFDLRQVATALAALPTR